MTSNWRFPGSAAAAAAALLALSGCAGFLPSAGPRGEEMGEERTGAPAIRIVDVTDSVARQLKASEAGASFAATLADAPPSQLLGPGDVIEVSIWEAPPAALFGSPLGTSSTALLRTSGTVLLPEQMIDAEGNITIPFAGTLRAADRPPARLGAEIARALEDKANKPQASVRVIRNATSNVTLVGELNSNLRMPLTARQERLLDALATAGGVRQATSRITVQVTRGERVASMPLDAVIRDPAQNIVLQPGDVITAMHQPLSFTVLGATGRNDEIPFESQGLTLAQALGRAGGLADQRADSRAVFVFRFEGADAPGSGAAVGAPARDRTVPVIYRANLRDPATFLAAQNFPMHDKDVLYVANAPSADLQKFLTLMLSTTIPVATINNLTK